MLNQAVNRCQATPTVMFRANTASHTIASRILVNANTTTTVSSVSVDATTRCHHRSTDGLTRFHPSDTHSRFSTPRPPSAGAWRSPQQLNRTEQPRIAVDQLRGSSGPADVA